MSKFFADSSDDSDESDNEEIFVTKPGKPAAAQFQFSDSEEDVKRVVQSTKDKRFEELRGVIKQITNHKKIKDMAKLLSSFEELCRVFEKSRKVIEKENLAIPKFYLHCLIDLEDFVNEIWESKEIRKVMSKANTRGLTAFRQKFRKYVKNNFENDMMSYRLNPGVDEVTELSEDEKQKDDKNNEDVNLDNKDKDFEPDEEKDSDDSWSMSSSSESSSDDEPENLTLDYFRKKTTDDHKKDKKLDKKKKSERSTVKKSEIDDSPWTQVTSVEKPKLFPKDAEINIDAILKKITEKIAIRGKKGTDRNEMIDILQELRKISQANHLGDTIQIKLLFAILPAIFDYNPNMATCMRADMWELCLNSFKELIDLLIKSKHITVAEFVSEDSETLEGETPRIRGSILSMMERVDEEFVKMLQSVDAHSTDYVDRLRDERRIYDLIVQTLDYLENREHTNSEERCRIYMKRIEHIYYKFDSRVLDCPEKLDESENPIIILDKLCKFIYTRDNTDRIRTRAILCQIYHHAIHDKWFEARDLMLMSHLQDTILHSDVPTQILYNRAMVQLGLCAFRQGYIKDAHNCLVDMQSGSRSKELLAQGLLMQRAHERTPDQEKMEKRRQVPYHRHINLELLECIYLISAMLLEVPYLAAHELDARRRMISKNFHHVLRLSEKQAVVGPPETMREHIVAASKAMKVGDWQACKNYLINEKMQQKVWSLMHNSASVKTMLALKIQEESLRTYLFTHAHVYNSLSLESICDQFDLEMSVVHSIISKMIINDELMASLDEPTKTLVMHRTEPTHIQSLCLQLSEKVVGLIENNEKFAEMKFGTYYYKQNSGGGNQQTTSNQKRDQQRNQRVVRFI